MSEPNTTWAETESIKEGQLFRRDDGRMIRVVDTDVEVHPKNDKGHDFAKVLRLDANENPRKRYGYDSDGRYTRVNNTCVKCKTCGVESGSTLVSIGCVDCDPSGSYIRSQS